MNIPKRLKEARKAIGYSCEKAAIRGDIRYANLYAYERGWAEPTFSELSKLAEVYKVTVDFLMGDKPIEKLNFIH
jgi:transcriptional regulator with XRE-family HTH domain